MGNIPLDQELLHEIFGSILDRTEMTPFLLLPAHDYDSALKQVTKMMVNRGFDALDGDELAMSERERGSHYIRRAYVTIFDGFFSFATKQLIELTRLRSSNAILYRDCLNALIGARAVLQDPNFRRVVDEDPRHLFLLASSRKYPHVFSGYQGTSLDVPAAWQQAACCLLKMAYLIKSVEEDSQDVNDYVQLAFFLEQQGQSLDELFDYDWDKPARYSGRRARATGLCKDLRVLSPPAKVAGL